MLVGDLLEQQGRLAEAVEAWGRIEAQNADYLALVAERTAAAYAKLGDPAQGIRVLSAWQVSAPSHDVLGALFSLVLAHEGPEAAAALVRRELARSPTLLGLDRLLEAQLAAAPAERRHDLELVRGLVAQHTKRLGMYRCEQCGFRARQWYWRCPGCQKWETYSPKRTESLDGQA
jgi:lipopolysaccharide biosynthesis regulator YciM